MFFRIVTTGCQKGYGVVKDFLGNTWFYGSLDDCQNFINNVEGMELADVRQAT